MEGIRGNGKILYRKLGNEKALDVVMYVEFRTLCECLIVNYN